MLGTPPTDAPSACLADVKRQSLLSRTACLSALQARVMISAPPPAAAAPNPADMLVGQMPMAAAAMASHSARACSGAPEFGMRIEHGDGCVLTFDISRQFVYMFKYAACRLPPAMPRKQASVAASAIVSTLARIHSAAAAAVPHMPPQGPVSSCLSRLHGLTRLKSGARSLYV